METLKNKKVKTLKLYGLFAGALFFIFGGMLLNVNAIEKMEVSQAQPSLYWHEVDENGELGPVINTVPQTKAESMSGSKKITDCPDQSTELCLAGFTTPQNEGDPAPSNPLPDYRINKEAL